MTMKTTVKTTVTAAEARKLMPSLRNAELVAEAVAEIDALIRDAANKDRTSIRIPLRFTNSVGGHGACSLSVEPLASIVAIYREAGYEVKDYYDCGQFVDSGATISWEGGKS